MRTHVLSVVGRVACAAGLVVPVAEAAAQPPDFRVENVVSGLDLACAMAFAPDGRLFVIERRTGNIVVVRDGAVRGVWATLPVAPDSHNSRGLLGIAIDPDFLDNGYVYVAHTRSEGTIHNAVARLRDVNGSGTDPTIIGPRIPASPFHNIGPLVFGSDGKLYVHTGDANVPQTAQRLDSPHGKILRMNTPDGSIPSDNPFVASYVWSYGHRNAFGLAVHPQSGRLYETENGDHAEDEINRIVRGANYGWPIHEGTERTPDPTTEDPLHVWMPPIGPAGCCFYGGGLYPSRFHHGWFLCGHTDGEVTLVELAPSGTAVRAVSTFLDYPGTLYGVVDGPDGNLWTLYSTGSTKGADSIDRVVYDLAPRPAVAVSAPSSVAVGGSATIGVTGRDGEVALAWIGASRFGNGVTTPFGALWVPFDIVLPTVAIAADDRVYVALAPPNAPGLRGITVHVQAVTAAGTTARLTNPASLRLR